MVFCGVLAVLRSILLSIFTMRATRLRGLLGLFLLRTPMIFRVMGAAMLATGLLVLARVAFGLPRARVVVR